MYWDKSAKQDEVHQNGRCMKWEIAAKEHGELNSVLTNKKIASQGYMPMTSYYLQIYKN